MHLIVLMISSKLFANYQTLCTLLRGINAARCADAISSQLEHLHRLNDKIFELHQKLILYQDVFVKLQQLLTNLMLCEEPDNTFQNFNPSPNRGKTVVRYGKYLSCILRSSFSNQK